MNFATKGRFGLNLIYLFTEKSDKIQFLIIKGHNFDYLENYLQTKTKRGMEKINGKNY